MKEYTLKYDKQVREYNSLSEFEGYLTNTQLNSTFRWKGLASVQGSKVFTQTGSYEEAIGIFKNGWDNMANKLTKKLSVVKDQIVDEQVKKVMYDVVGFQASVPRYLQGIPTSMVNKKVIQVKNKVITLNKDISYSAWVTTEEIVESSTQVLHLIKKIEAQGIRVNLNIIWGISAGGHSEVVKIRVKSAGERLNVSKLAFPLVHPSMLRRLLFRYVEVAPTITGAFELGYGTPMDGDKLQKLCPGEYVLPRLFDGDITKLGSLNSICEVTSQIKLGVGNKVKV